MFFHSSKRVTSLRCVIRRAARPHFRQTPSVHAPRPTTGRVLARAFCSPRGPAGQPARVPSLPFIPPRRCHWRRDLCDPPPRAPPTSPAPGHRRPRAARAAPQGRVRRIPGSAPPASRSSYAATATSTRPWSESESRGGAAAPPLTRQSLSGDPEPETWRRKRFSPARASARSSPGLRELARLGRPLGASWPACRFRHTEKGRGGDMPQRLGFRFCYPIWRLRFPQLLLLGVTCHAVAGCLLRPDMEGSGILLHFSSNKSNYDQGYCEIEASLASSLSSWTLSSEHLLAVLPVDPVTENYVRKVKNCIFSIAFPTPFKSRVRLVAVSKEVLEDILDLDLSVSESDDFLQLVSGGKILFGSIPLAHRYGGHQFGIWADQLGDGRAHLIGIYTNRQGEKWELQLKGSGKTPYSRDGDGRAVLRSSVREFLCSEAMYYLGIPTSRAASLVVSDDEVWRDQFYNGNPGKERGAVVLRVAKSWFRIGSLEILARHGELDLLRALLDFIIREHFLSVDVREPNRYVHDLLPCGCLLVLLMVSVCNTDNFSLLSITIDYGPFGFMEAYNPDFVPNLSDDEGRYKIGNQANVGMFNLNKLLQALNPLLDPRQKQLAARILEGYPVIYYTRFRELFKVKLGLLGESKDDDDLIAFLLHLMEKTEADFTMTFRQLSEITQSQLQELHIPQQFWALKMISKHELFPAWVSQYLLRLKSNMNDSDSERRRRMATVNPRYVLKNWMAESAVQKAERNDFSEVHLLQQVLQHPFQKHPAAEKAGYSSPTPSWAKDL
ncbi:Protein adenylyltransferase SelO, mitochondrial, partial [Galemys pyrenaicus]